MIWHFVNESTGEPTGRTFAGPARSLAENTPPGCIAVQGGGPTVIKDDPELRRSRTLRRIQDLEARQHRRIRELLMQSDPQLQALDDRIDQLRRKLNGETDTNAREG